MQEGVVEMISALLIEGKCLLLITKVNNLGITLDLWLLLEVQITMVAQNALFLHCLARKL